MNSKTYRDLELWQKAMSLAIECYAATKRFPKDEMFGLTSQIRRASVSIPANVAEGHGRQHQAEFIQHLHIARGSLTELETHVQIAQRLNYLQSRDADGLAHRTGEVGRLLNGMLRYLKSKPSSAAGDRRPSTDNREPL